MILIETYGSSESQLMRVMLMTCSSNDEPDRDSVRDDSHCGSWYGSNSNDLSARWGAVAASPHYLLACLPAPTSDRF
ncbi:hypothetical protein CBOM_07717 [Ceraceosorus bombacis]|uniref:Uncharacterized protein n=1 Tax=Ceraceosorus bombacis TaxID=401625 RepID=A0A0N7L903_9BASI|nr:hypothetical protein CBOM_07717 [Ceraceosorus bombacis]